MARAVGFHSHPACLADFVLDALAHAAEQKGRKAEGMVARGELTSVSIGYRVLEWEVKDSEGNVIDPERDRARYDDDLTFTATRWELYEVSLVTVPADAGAAIRSAGGRLATVAQIALARMRCGSDFQNVAFVGNDLHCAIMCAGPAAACRREIQ